MHTQSPEAKAIAAAGFPGYSGRKIEVVQFAGTMNLSSCWEGGAKDEYEFVHLETMKAYSVPENGTPWSNGGKILQCSELPMNVALVQHSRRGEHRWVTIYVRPENMTKMLAAPAGPALSDDEMIVLIATRSFKSSYAGRKNNRFYEANQETLISEKSWFAAKELLISKGFLNAAGAITDAGRNETESARLEQYRPKIFWCINKDRKTAAIIYGFDYWMQVQGAFHSGIGLPDGSRATGIGRSRNLERFVKSAIGGGYAILFAENDVNRTEIERLLAETPAPQAQLQAA